MIATAVKTDDTNPIVANLFGKAKWFALVNLDGDISIKKNENSKGQKVVNMLVEQGVKTVIFQHLGAKPYSFLKEANMECFFAGNERISLDELLEKYKNNELIKVTDENRDDFIEEGHSCNSKKHCDTKHSSVHLKTQNNSNEGHNWHSRCCSKK